MKLVLDQADVQQAIVDFLDAQGVKIDGANVHVNFIASPDEGMTASIDITPGQAAAVAAAAPVAVPASTPDPTAKVQPENPAGDPVDDLDREAIKKELDERGIEYLPKAHTGTLQAMLEEARASDVEAPVEDSEPESADGLFGNPAPAEDPPFNVDTPEAEKKEEVDEGTPLFGQ